MEEIREIHRTGLFENKSSNIRAFSVPFYGPFSVSLDDGKLSPLLIDPIMVKLGRFRRYAVPLFSNANFRQHFIPRHLRRLDFLRATIRHYIFTQLTNRVSSFNHTHTHTYTVDARVSF